MTISAQPQRPMRRRDRELPREEALRAARAAGHAVLSFIHPDTGVPQGVPISPVVTPEGIVYWHSTNEASLKGEGLKKDPRASLTFIAYAEDLPEEYTVDYASTVMTGRAHIVTDPQERRQAMLEICRRYCVKSMRLPIVMRYRRNISITPAARSTSGALIPKWCRASLGAGRKRFRTFWPSKVSEACAIVRRQF